MSRKCCCIQPSGWTILSTYNILWIGGIFISAHEKKSKKLLLFAGAGVAALALLVFLALLIWGAVLKNGNTVFPNVCVSGVNIGGMERDEAAEALENALTTTHSARTLTVQLPDRKLVFDPEMANSPLDTGAMVDAAMAYGRDGGPLTVLRTYIQCKNSAYILDLGDFLKVDTEYIRELIDKTAADVQREMVQSEISMDEENAVITIKLGYTGRSLNADALYETVLAAYNSGDLSDIIFSYDVIPYDIADLQSYYSEYCSPPRDAYYDENTHSLVEEVLGYGFDLMAANQQLALAEEGSTIEIPLEVMHPEVTLAELKSTYFSDVLASYDSIHTSNADRTTNLRLACEAIDGTVLNPGEIFSFNAIVGERTAEKGYKNGIIYAADGASEAQLGGGVCQVASTIYYCVLMADLEVVERSPHMYTVTYVPYGCDATIYWGSLDFKFKNSNSTPIMINASVSGGYVHISLMGTNEHDYTVKMTYELTATIPFEEIETLDETKEPGYREEKVSGYTGYTYWSYKNYYDLNGNFIRKEKCALSEYQKRDAEYIVGPEEPEEPELPEEPGGPGDVEIPDLGDLLNGTLFP